MPQDENVLRLLVFDYFEQSRKPQQNFKLHAVKQQEYLTPMFGIPREKNKQKAVPTGFSHKPEDEKDDVSNA